MGDFIGAVAGFPGVLFSSALGVVLAFWLLVALGGTAVDSFDTDADFGPVGLGGVPVAVAASLTVVVAWLISLAGSVAIARSALAGLAHAVTEVGLLVLSLLVAWWVARCLVRPLARLFPGEPGPPAR